MRDFIAVKKAGLGHSPVAIRTFISLLSDGSIPDYQTSAWLMAARLNGLSADEASQLALAMAESGTRLERRSKGGIVADKHSSGGVGDKISLIVVPLLAALGFRVPKLSGRGLGHTGGTIDKLESIPGFSTDLTLGEIRRQLDDVGCCISSQTADLAPADGVLYALRDVTETVDSIPLIAASIMSKKIASGADCLVLDVKYGSGALLKTKKEARELARLMTAIGESSGIKTSCLLGDMREPLGIAIGNSIEVREAVDVLRGGGPPAVRKHSVDLAGEALIIAGMAENRRRARKAAADCLDSGNPLDTFKRMVEAQGGDLGALLNLALPPRGYVKKKVELTPKRAVRFTGVDTEGLGRLLVEIGGGRKVKGEPIDPHVGIEYLVSLGQRFSPKKRVHLLNLILPSNLDSSRMRELAAHAESLFEFANNGTG